MRATRTGSGPSIALAPPKWLPASGAVTLETRCTGLEEGARAGGSEIIRLPLPANIDGNAATAEALKAERLKDPTIDSVVTLGAALTDSAAPPAGPTWCRRS